MQKINRRRFIAIGAAAAGCGLPLLHASSAQSSTAVTWRGQALGAQASLVIHHHDRNAAARLVRQVVTEVERLERVFSLYLPDSALSRLNRFGALAAPPSDLVALLQTCREVWELTNGAFDPTVQPLWRLLSEHFARPDADPAGPNPGQIADALALVGFDEVIFDRNRVALKRRGAALTLNGIAQGYITDRAVDILRRGGIENSLVDIGEIRALGQHPARGAWRVGIEATDDRARQPAFLELVNNAVATSSPDGFAFDPAGSFNHLLNPRSGASANNHQSVTVLAPEAVLADAFSTGFSLMTYDAVASIAPTIPRLQVHLANESGSRDLP